MKMIFGAGSAATDYKSFVYNYTLNQWNYKIPANSLSIIQLYVPLGDYGASVPGSQTYTLIHTCGADEGTEETITPVNYVAGLDPAGNAYMVINGFNETTTASCFVIAAQLDGNIWFSQEYTLDGCGSGLNFGQSCYGNLDPLISYDTEGIYFGQSQSGTVGDASVVYQHIFYMRQVELTINAIKNEFVQGRTRTFRTQSTDLYLFWGELIPEWYLKHVDAVFKRGEVLIGQFPDVYSFPVTRVPSDWVTGKYLVDSTNYEKVDECFKAWKPSATLKENFFNSFSCEVDPCTVIDQGSGGGGGGTTICCDPTVISATSGDNGEGGCLVTVNFTPCTPDPTNYVVFYRIAGTSGSYISAGIFTSSPAQFSTADTIGTQYEGFIYSNCNGVIGNNVLWNTEAAPSSYGLELISPCAAGYSPFILTGGTTGDVVVVRVTFSGNMARFGGSFVRADLKVRSPYVTDPPTFSPVPEFNDSSTCYVDSVGHGFNLVRDITLIISPSGATFDSFANVNNSNSAIPIGLLAEIITVNGSSVTGVSSIGCAGTVATAGTC